MTSKQRMLAAYKKQKVDRMPISPEIWSSTVLDFKEKPFHKYLGPFADEDYTTAWLEVQKHFGFDAWLLSDFEKPSEGQNYSDWRWKCICRKSKQAWLCYQQNGL